LRRATETVHSFIRRVSTPIASHARTNNRQISLPVLGKQARKVLRTRADDVHTLSLLLPTRFEGRTRPRAFARSSTMPGYAAQQ
jgi:hypothetical protein